MKLDDDLITKIKKHLCGDNPCTKKKDLNGKTFDLLLKLPDHARSD